jgi:hypothetical protein
MAERWGDRFSRVDPFRDLRDTQSEINRAFDAHFGLRARLAAVVTRTWAPALDIR